MIFDIFGKFAKNKDKEIKPSMTEIGESGTEISSGTLAEEYNANLNDVQVRCETYKVMRNESKLYGLLSAVKLPLLSANWFFQAAGDSDEDIRNKDFLQKALFEDLDEGWNKTLSQLLTYIDYGFYTPWINFKTNKEGLITWKEFAPRQQTAQYKWIQDKKGKLIGVQQNLVNAYGENSQPIMPIKDGNGMTRVMLLSYNQEGDNYEGRSILRGCYQSYQYKKLSMEATAVNIERYGVGVVDISLGSLNDKDISLAKEFARNFRSNKQSYYIHGKGTEAGFLQPDKDVLGNRMKDFIDTMNREMETAFLAKFLGSGDDGVGSNAKSKTDVEFFLLAEQQYARIIQDEINKVAKELIDLNFGVQESYPKLQVTEISKKDVAEFSAMLEKLTATGYVSPEEKKMIDFIREELNLPKLTDEEFEEMEEKRKEEKAIIDKAKKDVEKKEKEVVKKDDKNEKKKDEKLSDNEEGFFLADIKQVKLKERIFQKNINKEEDFLQSYYKKNYIPLVEKVEKDLQKYVTEQYKKAKTEVVSGTRIIKRSGNNKLKNETLAGVKERLDKFLEILEGSMMDEIHDISMENAIAMIRDVDERVELAEFIVSRGELNSFLAGYKSNMRGIMTGDGRRIEERVFDNFTQENQLELAIDQAKEISFNRNTYKLSAVSHPRGLFRRVVEIKGDREGVQKYKMIAPMKVVKTLSPFGALAVLLYSIRSKKEWNEKYGTKDNINVVGGLGIHHNSQEYYMPIFQEEEDEQEVISRDQRKELDDFLIETE